MILAYGTAVGIRMPIHSRTCMHRSFDGGHYVLVCSSDRAKQLAWYFSSVFDVNACSSADGAIQGGSRLPIIQISRQIARLSMRKSISAVASELEYACAMLLDGNISDLPKVWSILLAIFILCRMDGVRTSRWDTSLPCG